MTFLCNHGLGIGSFVEGGIIKNQHGPWWEFGKQIMPEPEVKKVSVHIGRGQAGCEQNTSQKCTYDIGSTLCLSVMFAKAALATCRVAVGTRHVMGKSTLVYVNDWLSRNLIRRDLRPKDTPCVFICLRM